MPCEHQITPYEESLLQECAKSKQRVGFDGSFTLPTEHRILLEAEEFGASTQLMRILKHLKLDREAARAVYYGVIREPMPASIQEVEAFFKDLRGY